MKMRVVYTKFGKFGVQKKVIGADHFFIPWWVDTHLPLYETPEEAKEAMLKELEEEIRYEQILKQRAKFSSGYQPVVVSTEDMKKKYPEYFL